MSNNKFEVRIFEMEKVMHVYCFFCSFNGKFDLTPENRKRFVGKDCEECLKAKKK